MNPHKGYYSLIQFCPDASRLESINLSVLVYSPETGRLQFQLAKGNERIRRVFGRQDWDLVDRARKSMESRLQRERFGSVSQLEDYIARRANLLQLTPLRSLRIEDIDRDVSEPYRRLVEAEQLDRPTRITTQLSRKLVEAGVAQLVRKSISVEIAAFKQLIRVPYGYQNGRFNLISPIQFGAGVDDILGKAGKSALEGQLLYDNPDPELGALQLVVIAKFAETNVRSATEEVRRIFRERKVALHTFDDMAPLVEDIKRSAVLHSR